VSRRLAALVAATLVAVAGCRAPARPTPAPAPPTTPAPRGLNDAAIARIDALLEAQRVEQHIPGLAFAVVLDDQVVYLKAFGRRDLERDLPATPDTVFPIGSCTKAFTSMAVAISQDRGLLSLDDSPKKYLPYFHMADPVADAQVTLRDMLAHRTGLRAYADLAAEPAVLSREEYVRASTAAEPSAPFRARFQYSNAMYAAVGEILGVVHGTSWERVIETEIFAPLGMRSSATAATATAADRATGYRYVSETRTWTPVPPPRSLGALAPGGSVTSSARDLTRWLRLLTGGGVLDGRRLVSTAGLRALTTPTTPINDSLSYALGWATYDRNGLRVVEHNGGSDGISALVSFIPERRAGFVFLANTSPNFMTKIGNAGTLLWPVILGEPTHTPAPTAPAHGAPAPAPPPPAPSAGDLPTVDALLARMIRAAGGERVLRRHRSIAIHATKTYANHGVIADLTIRGRAPDARSEDEVWTAVGKEIGRVRIYFDGAHGGQETTFGQDARNDPAGNERAHRDFALHPLLELRRLYREIRVDGVDGAGEKQAYVVTLVPADGAPVVLRVSTSTGLVIGRDADGASTRYGDFRAVDGEVVPYAMTIEDALGETEIRVDEVRFNVPMADAVFAPTKVPAGIR